MEFLNPCWFSLINIFSLEPTDEEIAMQAASLSTRLLSCEAIAQNNKSKAYDTIAQSATTSKSNFFITVEKSFLDDEKPVLFADCNADTNTECKTDFAACWVTLGRGPLFVEKTSVGYIDHISKSLPERLKICQAVVREARRQNTDPFLAIAVAFHESKFTNTKSPQNAQGPLGVMMRYHCDQKDKTLCDPITVGVQTLQKYIDLNQGDWCTPLAKFNAGECGRCDTPNASDVPAQCRDKDGVPKWNLFKRSHTYANEVYGLYEELCATFNECHTC